MPLSNENYWAKGVTASVLWDEELAPLLWEKLRNDEEVFAEPAPKPTSTDKNAAELPDKKSEKVKASPTPTPTDLFKSRTADVDSCGALR